MNTISVVEDNQTLIDNSTDKTLTIVNDSVSIIETGIQGPAGADGGGDAIQFSEQSASVSQTNFSISASATEIKAFYINGISYVEDVEINPPSSGTVVYSGGYTLESGDSVVIGYVE